MQLSGGNFVSRTFSFVSVAALAIMTAVPAAAQNPSPDHVRALIEQAKANIASGQAQPASPAKPATAGPKVDLTADEAVARALERNVTLASQRLTPRTYDYSIAALWANYRPNLTSMALSNSQTQLPSTTLEGGDIVHTDTGQWNAGLAQNLRWGGGNYSVNWNNSRISTDRINSTFNPSFGSTFQARYVQPILANRKTDANRTNIKTTAIQQDISELDLQATTASITAQVRNSYWDFVFSVLNLENQRTSLDLASKLVADNRARVEIGTMAPIDIVQAQAEEATRRQAVVNAEATLQNAELLLKRLIVSGTDDPYWTASLNPTDRPAPGTEQVDLEAAVRNALEHRTDLLTAKKNIDSANVTLAGLRNQTLPTLNLTTIYQLDGRGGTEIQRDRATNAILNSLQGSYWDALQNIGGWDAPTWTLQMNFSYPLGTSAAEANKARQQLIIQQNQTQVKATELQIATEVTAAAIAIRNSLEAIQAATAARELSQKRYEAAQSKLEVGMATNFEVVQAQRDLADARNAELREHLNYRRAVVDFQRTQVSPR
jgi:outer membrane protein